MYAIRRWSTWTPFTIKHTGIRSLWCYHPSRVCTGKKWKIMFEEVRWVRSVEGKRLKADSGGGAGASRAVGAYWNSFKGCGGNVFSFYYNLISPFLATICHMPHPRFRIDWLCLLCYRCYDPKGPCGGWPPLEHLVSALEPSPNECQIGMSTGPRLFLHNIHTLIPPVLHIEPKYDITACFAVHLGHFQGFTQASPEASHSDT